MGIQSVARIHVRERQDRATWNRVNTQCLLGLAAIKSGKAFEWDPIVEKVTNHPEAASYMTGSYREPWDLKKWVSSSD